MGVRSGLDTRKEEPESSLRFTEDTHVEKSSERTDRAVTEEEHITAADLAGTNREERPEVIEGTAVEVVKAPRDPMEDRDPDRSGTAIPVRTGAGMSAAAAVPAREPARSDENSGPLFSTDEAAKLRQRWDAIQVGFVDEPRKSVEEADSLVAAAMKRLAEQFAEERSRLEHEWDRGSDVSTEDLRVALRRYRSFFSRLLSV
jgi:hypothetical protein